MLFIYFLLHNLPIIYNRLALYLSIECKDMLAKIKGCALQFINLLIDFSAILKTEIYYKLLMPYQKYYKTLTTIILKDLPKSKKKTLNVTTTPTDKSHR